MLFDDVASRSKSEVVSVVLFTRAYAVWRGSRVIPVVLTLVYTVRPLLPMLFHSVLQMFHKGGIAGTSYAIHLFMEGVSVLGSYY